MKINGEERIWNMEHYRDREQVRSLLSIAQGGFTVKFSPGYFIEEFIANFEENSKKIPENLNKELATLKIPADVPIGLCNLLIYEAEVKKEAVQYQFNGWYDRSDIIGSMNDVYHQNSIFSSIIKGCLQSIIKENMDKLSPEMVNFVIAVDQDLGTLFIDSKTITEDAALYLVLTRPIEAIKTLDKNGLLQAKMIDSLLNLNPLAVYHVPTSISAWKKKLTYKSMDGEERVRLEETAYPRSTYIEKAIKYLIKLTSNDEIDQSHSLFGDDKRSYSGFSYRLGLSNESAILNYFLNRSDKTPGIHELRAISDHILMVKKPNSEDMDNLGKKVIEALNKEDLQFTKKKNTAFTKYIDYIEKYKDLMNKELYEEIYSKYYSSELLNQLEPFGVDTSKTDDDGKTDN